MNSRLDEAVENASERVDQVALRVQRPDDRASKTMNDMRITRIFPYFVGICILLWIVAIFCTEASTFSKFVELLCLSFTFCFAVLGVPCTVIMPKGVFSKWAVFEFAVILTLIMWLFNYITDEFYYAQAIYDMLGALGIHFSWPMNAVIGFLGTLSVILFTSIGVTSVVSAYLRRYIPTVLTTMQNHTGDHRRGKTERFFMIPTIIDVEKVVLDPPNIPHLFNFRGALSISLYVFIMGLMISSYLFVNPYFLDVMSWKTMLAVTIMLSMFIPALILPWQIFRGIGAKVESSAPRDYYLWEGAKHRLLSAFAALGAFMMMFFLSVYMGNDVARIVYNYVTFLVPLLVTAMMYGALYTNNFEKADREEICARYGELVGRNADRD